MKLSIVLAFLVGCFLSACSSSGWSEAEKQEYLQDCNEGMDDNPFFNGEEFCDCSLEKLMEEYDSPDEIKDKEGEDVDMEEVENMMELFKDCVNFEVDG